MAKSKSAVRPPHPPSQSNPVARGGDRSRDDSPARSFDSSSPHIDDAAAAAAAKKKNKKGKGKRVEDSYSDPVAPMSPSLDPSHHDLDYQSPSGTAPVHLSQSDYAANAAGVQTQAQADLLATASDLYRRIEQDPHGIPDDDAYWTSLPAHLRTFIRNALPLGQFSAAGGNDPNAKHASTQAMIAVAHQLAQAAQASQRHLQQYSGAGSHPYPPLSFDPAIFADLALQTDQSLSPSQVQHNGTNGTHAQAPYSHLHYTTAGNPPPTQPPGEPLPAPVVLVNEFGEEAADYGDEFSDEEADGLDGPMADHAHARRDATWSPEQGKGMNAGNLTAGHHGYAAPPVPAAAKKSKKKKKKNKAGVADAATVPAQATPPQSRPQQPSGLAPPAPIPRSAGTGPTQQPPPGSRAAGKQPMTFSASAKAAMPNGHSHPPATKRGASSATSSHAGTGSAAQQAPQQQQRIWSTSTAEERERIREFWLGLAERDRRSLLQVEKDAVLKKMKDQQRHTCSCAVCGRKRSAIESELDVLYNAYYEELEQYANHQQQYVKSGGTISPPPGPGPFPGSVALDSAGNVIGGNALTKTPAPPVQKTRTTAPVKKAPVPPEEDDAYDEELEEDEYDDDYDDEEEEAEEEEDLPDAHPPRSRKAPAPGSDVSPLGSSLTVKGGILTVADDLLKNDGQKFLEMMEQLADRRMQRQEDANAMLDALSEEAEDEADADDLDEEDEGEEEEDALTDEQRMEEGRRMFQVFAARLFEQRVLSAYREKVAQERQLQLLRELEEEDAAEKEREAKRQKENQRKKDKKRQAQLKKEEERLKRESEKAAEEAAAREKLEKQRAAEVKKQEEARAKREAEKKAKEEERLRKEEEKRKRQEEERAREAERERKRKEKEEKARQEKEAREAREAERKAKEEEARRQKERKEKERKAKEDAERAAQEAARREAEKVEKAAAQAQAKARQAQEQQRAAANAKAQPPSGPAKSPKGAASAPVSPASVRNNSGANAPRSPAANVNGGRARQVSVPPSPANAASTLHARAQPQPGAAIPPRPPTAPSQQTQQTQRRSGSQPPVPTGSSLPAPPQGLPARPSSRVPPSGPSAMTAAHSSPSSSLPAPAPTGPASASRSVGSDANSVVSPRAAAASRSSSTTIGAGIPAGPSAAATKPPSPPATQAPIGSTTAPSADAAQPGMPAGQHAVPASFSRGFTVPSFSTAGFPPGIASARSPILPNGVHSPMSAVSGAKSLDGSQSPHGVHEAAYALSSLNFGSQGLGSYANTPSPIGPPKAASPHGRMPSKDHDYGGMRSPSPQGTRSTIHRPGPIGPIGRPRRASEQQDDLVRPHSPRLPEGILGSSALGGDDELIAPQPRRSGSTVAPIGGGSALFGFGSGKAGPGPGGNGAAGAGAFGSSPWNSTSFASPTSAAPVAPGAAFGNLGAGLGGPGAPGMGSAALGPGAGVGGVGGGMGVDLWAPPRADWDLARFAFEQPSGAPGSAGQQLPQHQHAHQQPGQQPQSQQPDHNVLGGLPLSPYGASAGVGMGAGAGLGGIGGGARNIFGAPGGLPGSPVYRQPHEHRS